MLDRVTITGPDNSIRPEELVPLSERFPFVEWAILLSQRSAGNPRYPSQSWLDELRAVAKEHNLKLAGHVCGSWVRDLVIHKKPTVFEEHPDFLEMFPRIQLNFSPYHAAQLFLDVLKPYPEHQFIFQVGSKGKAEKETLLRLGLDKGLNLAVLFDRSGGKGVLPASWPEPLDPFYCGYAGGLGPDTLAEQLPKIDDVAGRITYWIDMESRVRSNDDQLFDLEKVRTCLEISQPWVNKCGNTCFV